MTYIELLPLSLTHTLRGTRSHTSDMDSRRHSADMDTRRSSLKPQSSGDSMTDQLKHVSNKTNEKPGPTSALLQDLLRAKKAESRRTSEMNNVDSRKTRRSFTEPNHRQAHSSPPAPTNGMQPEGKYYRRSSGVGLGHAGSREMGARETEEVSHPPVPHRSCADLSI